MKKKYFLVMLIKKGYFINFEDDTIRPVLEIDEK